jgi:hypothetical protein
MEWDGHRIADIEPRLPLVSSSFDPQGVHARRRAEFDRRLKAAGEPSPSLLFGFHLSHGNAPDAYSSCMHRPDGTRSGCAGHANSSRRRADHYLSLTNREMISDCGRMPVDDRLPDRMHLKRWSFELSLRRIEPLRYES